MKQSKKKKLYTIDNPKKERSAHLLRIFILCVFTDAVCVAVYQCDKDAKGLRVDFWFVLWRRVCVIR